MYDLGSGPKIEAGSNLLDVGGVSGSRKKQRFAIAAYLVRSAPPNRIPEYRALSASFVPRKAVPETTLSEIRTRILFHSGGTPVHSPQHHKTRTSYAYGITLRWHLGLRVTVDGFGFWFRASG